MEPVDICLVSMPFKRIDTPSLALGLLSAGTKQEGFSTSCIYAAFWLAEITGVKHYKLLELLQQAPTFYGEWLFSETAFPGNCPDNDLFFREKLKRDRILSVLLQQEWFKNAFESPDHIFDILVDIKKSIPDFVKKTADRILAMGPEIVGCSSSFQQHLASIALLRVIREKNPGVTTVMGGANCEGIMGVNLKRIFPFISYVATGEADTTFPRLCRLILERTDILSAKLPQGFVSDQNLPFYTNTADTGLLHPKTADLDSLPLPDFDDYFDQLTGFKYSRALKHPTLILETSRGCWWGQKSPCSFCGLNSGTYEYRKKKPEKAFSEILELSEKYGVDKILMADNILAMDYCHSFMPLVSGSWPSKFVFFWEVKANLAHTHVNSLRKAGVRLIQPGIEHLENRCLKLMNKGTNTLTNVALLKFALENGIWVAWNFLLDSPGEKDDWYETLCRWLPYVFHLQPPSGISSIRFDRFSSYGQHPERFGLNLVPREEYRHLYPLSAGDISSIAYYFEDTTDVQEYRGGVSKERLKKLVAQWHVFFNANPSGSGLIIRQEPGSSVIIDKRPCRILKEPTVIDGHTDLIYRSCRSPILADVLFRELSSQKLSLDRKAFDTSIHYLKENRLVLEIDHKLLSLAVADTALVRPLVTDGMFRDRSAKALYFRQYAAEACLPAEEEVGA